MPHLDPAWPDMAGLAVLLFALAAALRRWGRASGAAVLREAGLVTSLYAIWQWLGSFTHTQVAGATEHALGVWHAEQALHLPSELALQQAVLPHPLLREALNTYYLYGHFNPIMLLLAWVWWRHRDAYPRIRLLLCMVTVAAFALHFVPVAPPRLLPQIGFHDVALEDGQSVYGPLGRGLSGQLLAMPSLHVGWAILVAYAAVTCSHSRWRWLVVVHPVAMQIVVVATGNHWWADGIACGGLLALCIAAEQAVQRIRLRPVATADRRPARTLTT